MGWVDVAIVVLFVVAFVVGYSKGLVGQLTSLCGVLLAILAVWVTRSSVTATAASVMGVDNDSMVSHFSAAVVGCGLIFIVVWFCVWLLGRILTKTIRIAGLGIIDNVCGGVFMVFKYLVVISLLLNLWHVVTPTSPVFYSSRLLDGALLKWIMDLCPWLMGYLHLSTTNLTDMTLS